jgi:hypothetical protein
MASFGVSQMTALSAMFVLYAILGVAGAILYAQIQGEMTPIAKKSASALGRSRGIVYRMAALFSID